MWNNITGLCIVLRLLKPKFKSRFFAKLWCLKEYYCQLVLINFNNKLPANAGDTRDMGSITGAGRAPGGGNGNPSGSWQATADGSQTWLSEHADTKQHKTTDNSTPWKICIYFVTAFQDQIEPELYSINLSYWGKKSICKIYYKWLYNHWKSGCINNI